MARQARSCVLDLSESPIVIGTRFGPTVPRVPIDDNLRVKNHQQKNCNIII
jgi:hypothetical protein